MTLTALAIGLAIALFYFWFVQRARRLSSGRLADWIGKAGANVKDEAPARTIQSFPPRYRFVAYGAGVTIAAALWLAVGLPREVAIAFGILFGALTYLLEDHISSEKAALIEGQLASAIYLMVGSLRAGASLLAAFESALEEVGPPLRPYFQEVAGRIRLGDDPRTAVSDIQRHVPLETFRLFATSLAIHWEVGGSLATTLSTVGQTVRDRIELSRRVRAQSVESHASVGVVLLIAYLLAFLMWRTNPDRLEAFVSTGIGTGLVAAVIMLQAIGLLWMSKLSRTAF